MTSNSLTRMAALDECDRMFDLVRAASGAAEACHALLPLFDAYEVVNIEWGRWHTFWRARGCDLEPWVPISQMSYPPASHVRSGRLNDEHFPCFYGATRGNTALAEIGVKPGDFVQIAGFRVRPEASIRVAVIGELFHVRKTGYLRVAGSDPGDSIGRLLNEQGLVRGERTLYIDAFLSSLLADPDANRDEYTLSPAVASMIYRNTDIEGIMFPSVRDTHGMNLALRPQAFDENIHAVCCIHARISKVRSFGFVSYEIPHDAESVSPEGDLVWMPPQEGPIRRFFNLTKTEYDEGSFAARAAARWQRYEPTMISHCSVPNRRQFALAAASPPPTQRLIGPENEANSDGVCFRFAN